MTLTAEQIDTIAAYYHTLTNEEVARRAGVTPQEVSDWANANGLRKRPFAHRNRTSRQYNWRQQSLLITNQKKK